MLNLEDQYDRIFKYLYFRLHDRYMAEDMTQEAFLRFLGSRTYRDENRQLQYLYTIARNLCSQYYRDKTNCFIDAGDWAMEIQRASGRNIEMLIHSGHREPPSIFTIQISSR